MTINLPQSLFDIYNSVADTLLENNNIGKTCVVYYPPLHEICLNCLTNMDGSYSSNVYRHGGPAPFDFGNCPLCGGNGYKEVESYEEIKLRLYWNRKDWLKFTTANSVVAADAEVMIIGYMTDLIKINNASYIKLIKEQAYMDYKFVLAGDPYPHGFGKNRYFMGFLKRA